MNKKDLKKFLIENESHTIENTEEKLLSFVKGTMLNRNDVIDQDDQSHHRQEERLRNQLADSSTKRNKDEPGDGWLRMPRHHGRSNRQVQVARCTSTSAEKNDTKSTVS